MLANKRNETEKSIINYSDSIAVETMVQNNKVTLMLYPQLVLFYDVTNIK